MKKKAVQIKQHDITDCGAACLASVAAHFGYHLPIARIRQYASTDQKGTNVLGLIEAAEKIGFIAKGVKGVQESLAKIPKPAIAHVVLKNGLHHYVVIYKVTDKHVTVMDPGTGKLEKKSMEDFSTIWSGVLLLLMPDESFTKKDETTSVAKRFWGLVKPHKTVMLEALIGAIVTTILGLSISIYVQKIIDYVIIDGNKNLLNLLSISMIAILLLKVGIDWIRSTFILKTGQKIDVQLILNYYKHLMTLPQRFFDTMRVGEIISRLSDAVKIRSFINDASLQLIVSVLVVIFSSLMMFLYSWRLGLLVLISVPFYAVIYALVNWVNRKHRRKMMERGAELESQLVESLNNMGTIKRFGLEDYANIKTESRFVNLLKSIYKTGLNGIFASQSSAFVSTLFTVLLLWIGAGLVLKQNITPGELMSCYALLGYLSGPISTLIGFNATIQDALIAADRLFEIMDIEREQEDGDIELTPEMIDTIRFEDVSFRYGTRKDVFNKLNLTFSKGKISAVVGESGSGKSTLMSLLQKIYLPEEGKIYIGDYDIKHMSNESLRQVISVVPQDIDLFAGTIIENIAVGEFEPDLKRIIEICQAIGIKDFIEGLPNGLQTNLGENATNLSGGEKQRLAIARALYKDPEILILDEATSSLDSASEQYVQNTIKHLREQNKTIIIIAHRLSTIRAADQIVVIKQGQVLEQGTHDQLLKNQNNYYDLWHRQIGQVA